MLLALLAVVFAGSWYLRSRSANEAVRAGWSLQGPLAVLSGSTMGTTFRVVVAQMPLGDAARVKAEIEGSLSEVDGLMSTYDADSELSRFNAHQATDARPCSPMLCEVVGMAQKISEETLGAFDVTVGPLVDAWGFGPAGGGREDLDDLAIAELQARIGYQKLHSGAGTIRKDDPDLHVDLSAIAKGYGADRVFQALEERGLKDFLVEVGGELRAKGVNGAGKSWRVGIEDPATNALSSKGRVHRVVELSENAMATSGDYRNYREVDGQRISHTIDPRTGRPIAHGLASVSVVQPTAALADAYATALTVLGPQEGWAFAESHAIPAYFLVRSEAGLEASWTRSFAEYVQHPQGIEN